MVRWRRSWSSIPLSLILILSYHLLERYNHDHPSSASLATLLESPLENGALGHGTREHANRVCNPDPPTLAARWVLGSLSDGIGV